MTFRELLETLEKDSINLYVPIGKRTAIRMLFDVYGKACVKYIHDRVENLDDIEKITYIPLSDILSREVEVANVRFRGDDVIEVGLKDQKSESKK